MEGREPSQAKPVSGQPESSEPELSQETIIHLGGVVVSCHLTERRFLDWISAGAFWCGVVWSCVDYMSLHGMLQPPRECNIPTTKEWRRQDIKWLK